jgi:cytochrome c553
MVRVDVRGLILASTCILWHHIIIMSINGSIKKRGRPSTGAGQGINVRLQPDQLAALDAWIEAQATPKPTRPEAIRQLLKDRLK